MHLDVPRLAQITWKRSYPAKKARRIEILSSVVARPSSKQQCQARNQVLGFFPLTLGITPSHQKFSQTVADLEPTPTLWAHNDNFDGLHNCEGAFRIGRSDSRSSRAGGSTYKASIASCAGNKVEARILVDFFTYHAYRSLPLETSSLSPLL